MSVTSFDTTLFEALRWQDVECFVVAYFDDARHLITISRHSDGLRNATTAPLRTVFAEGLAVNAASMIVAHNHPGGSALPSASDTSVTRKLAQLGDALGLRLIDHLILAGNSVFSYRDQGLL